MLILTYISVKWNQRAFLGLFTQFWFLPCLIALAVLPEGTPRWGSYALVTVILSYPSRMFYSHLLTKDISGKIWGSG
jgi:hypothetical protein